MTATLLPAGAAICVCLPLVTRYDHIVTATNSAVPADGITPESTAPGPLELVQSFANTLGAAGGDLLDTREKPVAADAELAANPFLDGDDDEEEDDDLPSFEDDEKEPAEV